MGEGGGGERKGGKGGERKGGRGERKGRKERNLGHAQISSPSNVVYYTIRMVGRSQRSTVNSPNPTVQRTGTASPV
jgi:hypothetical protein